MKAKQLWEQYKQRLCVTPSIGLMLDTSRMNIEDGLPGSDGTGDAEGLRCHGRA